MMIAISSIFKQSFKIWYFQIILRIALGPKFVARRVVAKKKSHQKLKFHKSKHNLYVPRKFAI